MTRPSADDIDDDEESSMPLDDNAVKVTNNGVIFLAPIPLALHGLQLFWKNANKPRRSTRCQCWCLCRKLFILKAITFSINLD